MVRGTILLILSVIATSAYSKEQHPFLIDQVFATPSEPSLLGRAAVFGAPSTIGSYFCSSESSESTIQNDPRWHEALEEAWKAVERKDWKRVEDCILEASKFGPLREGDLRTLAIARRLQDNIEGALEISELNFKRFPSVPSALDLAESYLSAGSGEKARGVLRSIQSDLITSDPAWTGIYNRVALRQWEISLELDHRKFEHFGKERFAKNGYYESYIAVPVDYQSSRYKVNGALRFEKFVDKTGNSFLRIWPKDIDTSVSVTLHILQNPCSWVTKNCVELPVPFLTPDIKAFLGRTCDIDPSTPLVQKIARELKGATIYETLLNIRRYADQNLRYIFQGESGVTFLPGEVLSDVTLRTGRGRCGAQASALAAILRANGIPARLALGFSGIIPNSKPDWHTWVEVYVANAWRLGSPNTKGATWVPFDADVRPGSLNVSLIRLAAETLEDADAPSGQSTTARIFFCMFQPSEKGGPANLKSTYLGSSLDAREFNRSSLTLVQSEQQDRCHSKRLDWFSHTR